VTPFVTHFVNLHKFPDTPWPRGLQYFGRLRQRLHRRQRRL